MICARLLPSPVTVSFSAVNLRSGVGILTTTLIRYCAPSPAPSPWEGELISIGGFAPAPPSGAIYAKGASPLPPAERGAKAGVGPCRQRNEVRRRGLTPATSGIGRPKILSFHNVALDRIDANAFRLGPVECSGDF